MENSTFNKTSYFGVEPDNLKKKKQKLNIIKNNNKTSVMAIDHSSNDDSTILNGR